MKTRKQKMKELIHQMHEVVQKDDCNYLPDLHKMIGDLLNHAAELGYISENDNYMINASFYGLIKVICEADDRV